LTVGARAQPLTRPNSLAHHARATSAGVLLIANRCPPPIQNGLALLSVFKDLAVSHLQ